MGMQMSKTTFGVLAVTSSLLSAGAGLVAAESKHSAAQANEIGELREQVRNLTDSGISSVLAEATDASLANPVDSGIEIQDAGVPAIGKPVNKQKVGNFVGVFGTTEELENELRPLVSDRERENNQFRPLRGGGLEISETVSQLEERTKREAIERRRVKIRDARIKILQTELEARRKRAEAL